MTRLLDAVCEPRELILAWQSSDLNPERRYRYAIGRVEVGDPVTFRYFDRGGEFERHNQGRPYAQLEELGFRGYPAFDRGTGPHSTGVMEAFMRRLPPRSRSDFTAYAERFMLSSAAPMSDLTLLGRTEATLPSDGFSLVDPLDPSVQRCDLLLEVAGYRHHAKKADFREGQPASVLAEETEHDVNAVSFTVDGHKIGNVNRLQAATFRTWLREAKVDARIERLNGTAERPRAFVFVRVLPSSRILAA